MLRELLRIFNNKTLDEIGGDVIGRIYEYFLSKFAKAVASDDGVFFTPKSLVKMLVNVLEPKQGIMLDPACGSGGMFVQTGDFVNAGGMNANTQMTFYGQEKVEYNAQLCLMNMAFRMMQTKGRTHYCRSVSMTILLTLHYIQLKSHHDKFDINHKNILFYHNYLHK